MKVSKPTKVRLFLALIFFFFFSLIFTLKTEEYESLEELQEDLRKSGLEASSLIVGMNSDLCSRPDNLPFVW